MAPTLTNPATPTLSDEQRAERRAALDRVIGAIRPAIAADGGDIHVVGVDPEAGRVEVALSGACGTCPVSSMTLHGGVERILKAQLDWVQEVVGEARTEL